ncbi:phosphoenolpyruvate carboxykinase (ATP) [Iris pallida]|uniref:Phosphoenolpyruvate carboxykinase (ATP) n=1 Tax=Iris pallida TaxID=29817 RepID=A0AAX6HAH3_IRIPA|nr:phosphoenolpyruvate carboxykinase (ATP) [Iris pallida]
MSSSRLVLELCRRIPGFCLEEGDERASISSTASQAAPGSLGHRFQIHSLRHSRRCHFHQQRRRNPHIWDTARQERFQSLGVAFYHGADCFEFILGLVDHLDLLELVKDSVYIN